MASTTLNPNQQNLLKQFKVNIKDVLKPEYDDDYILRWLRAREWDLKKSEKMLRDSLEWRKRFGTDDIMKWEPPEAAKKFSAGGYFGVSKEGIPIWYELLGRMDVRGLMFSVNKKDLIRYRMKLVEYLFQERFEELSKQFGKKIRTCVYICDLEGISMKHVWKPAVDVYTELLATVEANYPETLHCCYVINAPAIFPLLYSLVKPFLAPETRSKIRILGSNWKSVILKDINPDQLPVYWGGTAKDSDGDIYCKSQICLGGTIPESYYLKNVADNFDLNQFTTITVNRGSFSNLDFKVDKPKSVLRWNFWTDNNDICYGVYRQTEKGKKSQKVEDMVEILEPSRCNSHIAPEFGWIECNEPGTYIVHFNNSYSWVTAKKLSYLIEIVAPDNLKDLKVESTDF